MTTSVAICTYNGEKYIEEQLLSIINQSHPVDEIILCDDGSLDNTLNIVDDIKSRTNDISWIIKQNKNNIGFCDNFSQALSLCHGDIIFLSDQDDIWREDKIEVICDYFYSNPGKKAVFTNAELLVGNTIHESTIFDVVGFTSFIRKYFDDGWEMEIFAYDPRATGATMAIKRELLDGWNVSSKFNNKWGTPYHDIQIVFQALEDNSLGYISDCLIKYRIHKGQTSGLGEYLNIKNEPNVAPYVSHFGNFVTLEGLGHRTEQRLRFLWQRAAMKEHRYGRLVIMNLHRYVKIYRSQWLKPFLSDLHHSLFK